jgi:NADH-quinone oxidoreductase subunit J
MAIVQILVYAGAIMVLFLFVLMLLNQRDEELGPRKFSIAPLLGMFAAAVVSVSIGAGFMSYRNATANFPADVPLSFGTAEQIGRSLMTTHLLPFELVSLLLLIGIVSAVVVAKRRL